MLNTKRSTVYDEVTRRWENDEVNITWSSLIGVLGSELVHLGEFTKCWQGEFAHRRLDQYPINFVYHYSIRATNRCKSRVFLHLSRKKNMQEAPIKKLSKLKSYLSERKWRTTVTLIGLERPLHYHWLVILPHVKHVKFLCYNCNKNDHFYSKQRV